MTKDDTAAAWTPLEADGEGACKMKIHGKEKIGEEKKANVHARKLIEQLVGRA